MTRIYLLQNNINGKVYVGKTTKTVHRRWIHHRAQAKGTRFSHYPLYRALRKYGEKNFSLYEIDSSEDFDRGSELEKFYIQVFKAYDPDFGYNLTLGGEGVLLPPGKHGGMKGFKHSEETKAKMSDGHKGLPGYWKGKKLLPEAVEKIAEKRRIKLPMDEIVSLYESGKSMETIGELYGVSGGCILKRLKRFGIKRRVAGGRRKDGTQLPQEEIASLYAADKSINELADMFDVSPAAILRRLRNANVKMRPRHVDVRKFSDAPSNLGIQT